MTHPDAEWEARNKAHLAKVGDAVGFDATEDHAALIVRLLCALDDRYSEDRSDPVLAPIIEQAAVRYDQLRRHGFQYAQRLVKTEAVRTILALTLP